MTISRSAIKQQVTKPPSKKKKKKIPKLGTGKGLRMLSRLLRSQVNQKKILKL